MQVYQKLILASALLLAFVGANAQEYSGPDLRLNTIVIDPGHGGKDPGAVSGDRKTQEKALTLKISKMLSDRIKEMYPEMKVILTRSNDQFVELSNRAKKATNNGAQLFISVHINAAKNTSANGYAVYILGPSKKYDSYEVNLETLRRENSVIDLEEDSASYKDFDESSPESMILLQLMQNAFREQSLMFGEIVSKHLEEGPFKKNSGVMQDNFHVLRQASMPAVLLELGFISNSSDLKVLRDEECISKIVEGLADSLDEYKKMYDQSVSLDYQEVDRPSAGQKDSVKIERAVAADKDSVKKTDETMYGVQVLASGKLMSKRDTYFKGYEVKILQQDKIYKYIIGFSSSEEEVEKKLPEIKKKFKDGFIVKIEGEIAVKE